MFRTSRTTGILPLTLIALLTACGGGGGGGGGPAPIDFTKAKDDCVALYRSDRSKPRGTLSAFDAWQKGDKVIVQIGSEQKVGKGSAKRTVRTVLDHCMIDPAAGTIRLSTPFDQSWARDEETAPSPAATASAPAP